MKLTKTARKYVTLDMETVMRAGVSGVLAVDASVLGATAPLLAEAPLEDAPQDAVAVVRIEGPLAQRAMVDLCAYVDGYDSIAARFQAAVADDRAHSVLLVIDSPGGDVAGLEEAVARMKRAKVASGKPVVAYIDELAASAAYWIAAGVADKIVVPGSGAVGSIGCIGAWIDRTAEMKAKGITWHVVRDPAGKAETMSAAPLAELADERMRAAVEAASGRFMAAIAEARGMGIKKLRGLNAALLEGAAAVDAGLADEVGSLDDAAARAVGLSKSAGGKKKTMSLSKAAALLGIQGEATAEQVEAAVEGASKKLLDATGSETIHGAIAAIDALKVERDALKEKAAQADALAAQIAEQKAAAAKQAIQSKVDGAVKAGKLPPARRESTLALADAHGEAWLDALIESLPVQVQSTAEAATKASDATMPLDSDLLAALKRAGVTEDDYRAAKAAGL
jgi:ClpP class serine protease